MVGKDLYELLGEKIDNLTAHTPRTKKLYEILKLLYSKEEAEFVIKMPYNLSNLNRLVSVTKYSEDKVKKILDTACSKGLIMDFFVNNEYYYLPSPIIIGFFEFTLMRTGGNVHTDVLAKLFYDYLENNPEIIKKNFGKDKKISILRTLPHEESIKESFYNEILDYEKARAIIKQSSKFAISTCACRHEKTHLGIRKCTNPLDTCSSFDRWAEMAIRHKFGKEVSKEEMLENLERSKHLGLVLNADNVKNNVGFICHCCKCCCTGLAAYNKYGGQNIIVTSTFINSIDDDKCNGCGVCAKICPVNAITMQPETDPKSGISTSLPRKYSGQVEIKKQKPVIDESRCLGCGVCGLKCPKGAAKLVKRKQRVLHPDTTFERVVLQCLERGTLQNQIFDDPSSISHNVMRRFIGTFLKLDPVKKTLMSEMFRSSFLASLKTGAKIIGKKWMTEI